MVCIKDLLKKFNINLNLPDHILNLKFDGDYIDYSEEHNSVVPELIRHNFFDKNDEYILTISEFNSAFEDICQRIKLKTLLNKFNLDLDLPKHILNLRFIGNYTYYSKITNDPDFPNETFHLFIDKEKNYCIRIPELGGKHRQLDFWEGTYNMEYGSEWEESYYYDDDTIPPHYFNN